MNKLPLPQAFYAGRVTETLRSVAHYVKEAREIADDIKPVSTTAAPVTVPPVLVGPNLKSVDPSSIEITERTKAFTFNVKGDDVQEIERFGLIPAGQLSDAGFFTKQVSNLTAKSFSAVLDIGEAPAQAYHAWVQDKHRNENLLRYAVTINPSTPASSGSTSIKKVSPKELHIFINDVVVVGVGHFPDDISFEIENPLEIDDKQKLGENVVNLFVNVPASAASGQYELRASSVSLVTTDKVTLAYQKPSELN